MPQLNLVLQSANEFWMFQSLSVMKWKYSFIIIINNTAYMLTLALYEKDLQ